VDVLIIFYESSGLELKYMYVTNGKIELPRDDYKKKRRTRGFTKLNGRNCQNFNIFNGI
jgi:hypothetical protein